MAALAPLIYPSVTGDLDLNAFRGTRAEFQAFADGSPAPASNP
jgi:hypothetical protein